jgi:thiamine-monophosphate kinase
VARSSAPLGEFELIAKYFAPLAAPGALGMLDDAAILTPPAGHDIVVTKDMLVAGVHFFADDPPAMIAQKALRVNLSDLAAKGATPLGFLLGLALPRGWQEDWLKAFATGLKGDARRFSCPLYGGDTVSIGAQMAISITAFGAAPQGRMVRRGGARPGDYVYVSGNIGDGALGLIEWQRQQSGEPFETALAKRYLVPTPRLALAPALLAHAHGAMDVSDGLIGDAAKMAAASGVGLRIFLADVPLSAAARRLVTKHPALLKTAVTGGDDYEILCAIPPAAAAAFETAAGLAKVAVKLIGECAAGAGLSVLDGAGRPVTFQTASYRHF